MCAKFKYTFSRLQDRIPLGETIPAISMFYVYMVPTPTDVCYAVISRAASSVGVMYRVSGPNKGSNPGGGQILNKNK